MEAFNQSLEACICCIELTLPRGPVEPTIIALTRCWEDGSKIGSLLAPCGVRADNIFVRGFPKFVCLGRPFQFELVLSANYPWRNPDDINIASASIAFHTRVDAFLVNKRELPQQLFLRASLENASGIVSVNVDIPEETQRNAEIVISRVSFAGQAVTQAVAQAVLELGEWGAEGVSGYISGSVSGKHVAECVGHALSFHVPVRLRVVTGMHAPLRLEKAVFLGGSTPVITSDGTLYAPALGSTDMLVFAFDGTLLPPLPLDPLGLSSSCNSAFVHNFGEAADTLLLANDNNFWVKLVAVDAASKTVRWSAASIRGTCDGLAVLPSYVVVIVSDRASSFLHVYCLSDGTLIASVKANEPTSVAADPASATVYVSTYHDQEDALKVSAFRWDGATLVFDGVVEAAGATDDRRPLAVMPPAPGFDSDLSYLVVGSFYSSTLHVLSLPDRRLVNTHDLEGIKVVGLAADPSGTALAVCDGAYRNIHVLPWPLPGMKHNL